MKNPSRESINIQVLPATKEKLISLCGERGMGKAVDVLAKYHDQQTALTTLVGRLDSISRAQDSLLAVVQDLKHRLN